MKRSYLHTFCLGALLMLLGLSVQPARAQFGIAAGLNFEDFNDIETQDAEATFDNATGYHIGIFYDLSIGPLALRPGLFYRDIGEVETSFPDVPAAVSSFDLSLIEVPVDLRFRLPFPLVSPYAMAGPVFMFPSTDNEDFEDEVEDFTVAANIGAGVELSVPVLGVRLFPEIRYGFGITRFMQEEIEIGGVSFTAEEEQRFNTLMLRLGLAF